ncbi:MAG: NAD(P)-dependent oxidoreductase [Puniceicoccaceae bacterium]
MKPRVLVTGASGFVGSRLIEVLEQRSDWQIRALVHRPSSGVRLSHLKVETLCGDICDPEFVARAMQDVDAVVHLAYQNQPTRAGQSNATVQGTRVLATNARQMGVSHFVHISTLGVFSYRPRGPIEESAKLHLCGDAYCDDKIRAERWVSKVWKDESGYTILRFANVYGPYSPPWVIRILNYLKTGRPVRVGDGQQAFSLLYVDNAVQGILAALQKPPRNAVYHLCDAIPSVSTYMETLASWLPDTRPLVLPLESYRKLNSWRSKTKVELTELRTFLIAPETKVWLFRLLEFPLLLQRMLWVLNHLPAGLRQTLRSKILGMSKKRKLPDSGTGPQPTDVSGAWDGRLFIDAGLYHLLASNVRFESTKAQQELGFCPVVSLQEGLELTRQWCEWAGLLETPRQ